MYGHEKQLRTLDLYDKTKSYLIVRLKNVYYHYCNIPEGVVGEWLAADSKGRFYNANVREKFGRR